MHFMQMDLWPAPSERNFWACFSVVGWLAVFLSPSAYFILLTFWSRSRVPIPPVAIVVSLFGLVPIVALLVCGTLVWRKNLAMGWKVGRLVLTVLGMALQVGVLLLVIRTILVAAISYAQ